MDVARLHIGQDVVELPPNLHLRGDADTGDAAANLRLINWQVRDGWLWFTLERVGLLRGPLLEALQGALLAVINGMLKRRHGDRARLERRDGQLGIPLEALPGAWGGPALPIEVTGIEVQEGVAFSLEWGGRPISIGFSRKGRSVPPLPVMPTGTANILLDALETSRCMSSRYPVR